MRVPFTEPDLEATRRSMSCHKTQYPDETVEQIIKLMRDVWKGELPLSPMVPQAAGSDLFR
jgi:hypothetical protein